jgi:hypothetical protein
MRRIQGAVKAAPFFMSLPIYPSIFTIIFIRDILWKQAVMKRDFCYENVGYQRF